MSRNFAPLGIILKARLTSAAGKQGRASAGERLREFNIIPKSFFSGPKHSGPQPLGFLLKPPHASPFSAAASCVKINLPPVALRNTHKIKKIEHVQQASILEVLHGPTWTFCRLKNMPVDAFHIIEHLKSIVNIRTLGRAFQRPPVEVW